MSNISKPNIGSAMTIVHNAITRGLEESKKRSIIFLGAGYTNAAVRGGFETYVRTLGMVIKAHHSAEDHVVYPYLKPKLPDAPYDQLSIEHQQMDVLLNELKEAADAFADQNQDNETLKSLDRIVTNLTALWIPHIATEQLTLYEPPLTEAIMNAEEQLTLIQTATKHSLEQGNPALIVPFILYDLESEDRENMAVLMPTEILQEMIPTVWKHEWSPMQPFLLD